MRNFTTALLGFLLVSPLAHADSSVAYIDQVPPSLSDGKLESAIVIRTNETGPSDSPLNLNFRLTNTPLPGAATGGNRSTVIQNGNDNSAVADINGGGNVTEQRQDGNQNDSTIRITDGYENAVKVEQNGDNHRSVVDLTNTVGQEVVHIQHGSGKSATISRSGAPTQDPIIIEQRSH